MKKEEPKEKYTLPNRQNAIRVLSKMKEDGIIETFPRFKRGTAHQRETQIKMFILGVLRQMAADADPETQNAFGELTPSRKAFLAKKHQEYYTMLYPSK